MHRTYSKPPARRRAAAAGWAAGLGPAAVAWPTLLSWRRRCGRGFWSCLFSCLGGGSMLVASKLVWSDAASLNCLPLSPLHTIKARPHASIDRDSSSHTIYSGIKRVHLCLLLMLVSASQSCRVRVYGGSNVCVIDLEEASQTQKTKAGEKAKALGGNLTCIELRVASRWDRDTGRGGTPRGSMREG
jgi:hypothetical protein